MSCIVALVCPKTLDDIGMSSTLGYGWQMIQLKLHSMQVLFTFLVHLLGVALCVPCILCVYRMLSSFTMHIVYVLMHALCCSLVSMIHAQSSDLILMLILYFRDYLCGWLLCWICCVIFLPNMSQNTNYTWCRMLVRVYRDCLHVYWTYLTEGLLA